MLMTFFEQEQMNGKLTQMLHLNESKKTENQEAPFSFPGVRISQSKNKYQIDQDLYMSQIARISCNAEFSKFASKRI